MGSSLRVGQRAPFMYCCCSLAQLQRDTIVGACLCRIAQRRPRSEGAVIVEFIDDPWAGTPLRSRHLPAPAMFVFAWP
jgi:hypothetical protein